jgi:PAS domain S-box-containing protein
MDLITYEIRYRSLFESAKDGILFLDAETGKIVDVNPFLMDLLDHNHDQFIEKSIWEIGIFKDIIDNQDKFIELRKNKYVRYNDLPLETKDGRIINVEFVSNVYLGDNQNVIQCNIRDITAHKIIEEELIRAKKQAEEKGKNVTELRIVKKELDYQVEEKEKLHEELIITDKELTYQNELKEKREEELIIANKELVFQNKEKEKRANELENANKELAYQNDLKEKRAAELIIAKERAEESDRLKSAFLTNMSHEIRTPMNGILGFANLLKEPSLTGDEQQNYIRIIEKSGARMLNIINDIISISKIESGLTEINISESNINEQVEYIYNFFKPEVEGKGIQFSYKNSLPLSEAIIKTDREKLFAILTNLVKNAIKYCDKGS